MFLPLGDAPNPKGFPLVTYAIIALNVAVFAFVTLPLGAQPANPSDPAYLEYLRALANALPPNVSLNDVARQLSAYDLFVFRHGYRSIAPSPWALVESMFLHSGFMHLFGNMLFAIDQQQYLQGYLPVVLLTLYAKNLNTVANPVIMTGPGFVTQDTAERVIALSQAGTR